MKKKIKENQFIIYAFLIPFFVMGLAFVFHKFFPFGDQQILIIDLWHQYFPFLNELHEKLLNGESLLYSWRIGMGTNFLGLASYYCSSPLNLLLIVVPEKFLVVGLEVLVLMRMGLASAFSALFLKKTYKRNTFALSVFGASYGLAGFFFGYYWNVMWLDTAALIPLLALGIHQVVKKKDFRLYVIVLGLSLFSNYYIGLFSCIFCGLYYFGACMYENVGWKRTLKGIGRMAVFSAMGIGLAAILLIPAYLCLKNTYYASSSFPTDISFFYNLPELLKQLFAFTEPSYVEGAPNIYSGLFVLLFAIVFISARKTPLKEKIYYGVMVLFLLLSFNMNVLDFIWHGFHWTNMVPHRFAFLFTFFIMIMAYRGFLAWRKTDFYDSIIMGGFGIGLLAIGFFAIPRKIWIANIALVVIYYVIALLHKKRVIKWDTFFAILSVVLFVEYLFGAYISVDTAGSSDFTSYPYDREIVHELVDNMEKNEDNPENFYRVEFATAYSLNDGSLFGTRGVTCFSSMCNSKLSFALEKMGLAADDGSNRYAYCTTSPIASSFLNVKYLITREGAFSSDTWEKVDQSAHIINYHNKYELPLGFMTNKEMVNTSLDFINPFDMQNEMFRLATGIEDNVFSRIDATASEATDCAITVYDDESFFMDSNNSDVNGKVQIKYDVEEGEEVFAYVTSNLSSKNISITGIGEEPVTIDVTYPFIKFLKHADQALNISFEYTVKVGEQGDGAIYFRKLNKEVLDQGYERLIDEPMIISKTSDTKIVGTVTAKQDGYLYTSIPYEKGWTLYVDGKKTEIEPFCEAFIGVMLEQGEHEIVLKYMPDGFLLGCLVSGIALLAFAGCCILRKKLGENKCS